MEAFLARVEKDAVCHSPFVQGFLTSSKLGLGLRFRRGGWQLLGAVEVVCENNLCEAFRVYSNLGVGVVDVPQWRAQTVPWYTELCRL